MEIAEAIYVVTNDVLSHTLKISTTNLCLALNKVIKGCAVGAQDMKSMWRLYVNNTESRLKLLESGLPIEGSWVALHPTDPSTRLRKPTERVVVKDIPLPVSNSSVLQQLKYLFPKLKITSEVLYAKDDYFSKDTNMKMFSNFLTGDRFFYIETPVSFPLPKIIQIEGRNCRVWHYSQKFFCKRCDKLGHTAEDIDVCEAYIDPNLVVGFRYDKI